MCSLFDAYVFSDESLLQKWLDAKVVLAIAEAQVGSIPQEAADKINLKAKFENISLKKVQRWIVENSHPLITLISELESVYDGDAEVVNLGRYYPIY